MHNNLAISTTESSMKDCKAEKDATILRESDKVKIGKTVYTIERHFSDERDMRDAVFTVVQNEAFRAS